MNDTFGNLIERARTFLRDDGGSFIDDEDLGSWINEAQRDIAARLEVMQRTETGVVSTTQAIVMPTGDGTFTVVVHSLRLAGEDVTFVDDAIFNSWADATATPPTTLAKVWGDEIVLYPVPDGIDYELKVAYIPAELVSSSDVHVLPVQLERKLIEYTVAQAKLKDEDYAGSDRWLVRYEQGLPQVSTGRTQLQPGPMSLTPEPSYFDLDALQHRSSRS